jgi:hypothetical protein
LFSSADPIAKFQLKTKKNDPKAARRREFLKLERDLSNFPSADSVISYLKNLTVDNLVEARNFK